MAKTKHVEAEVEETKAEAEVEQPAETAKLVLIQVLGAFAIYRTSNGGFIIKNDRAQLIGAYETLSEAESTLRGFNRGR